MGFTYTQYFRYSMRQKDIYKLFMEGEVSEKKFSPEQVHLLIRKELQVSEYVTTQQIRSLFSRTSIGSHNLLSFFSRLKKDKRLSEPIDVCITNVDNEEEEEIVDQDQEELANEEFEKEFIRIAIDLSCAWHENDWIVVIYIGNWYPGIINEVLSDDYMVSCMKYASADKNLFKRPAFPDVIKYNDSEIICGILTPLPLKNREETFLKLLRKTFFSIVSKMFSTFL
ncbi:uncharacterized protein LOC136077331 [Hydra vulgaris]|uniref:uncharacterized protein LOC136077331 n=1 Tax=Hydra vulgaris TaxID=6087 RepID=UPI0032E9F70D